MSSPEAFARGNGSYWAQVTPRLEPYVRSQTLIPNRFSPPIELRSAARRHALVSELAFEQFSQELEGTAHSRPAKIGDNVVDVVVRRIQGFSDVSGKVRRPSRLEREEAWELRRRLRRFVSTKMNVTNLTARPRVPGCGSLRAVQGDLFGIRFEPDLLTLLRELAAGVEPADVHTNVVHQADVLYEIKSVSRRFGSQDLRQLLVYSAMLQAVGSTPRHVGLVNPTQGTFVEWRLNDLCLDIAGSPVDEVLQQIITDVSIGISA